MRAGLFNYRVNFMEPSYTVNAYGDRVASLSAFRSDVWAAVKFIGSPSAGASEEELNNQTTGKVKIELKCRYFGNDGVGNNRGPNYKDVIRFDGADWDIYDIHIIGRRELYMIRAEARDDLTTVDHIANPAPAS